MAEILNKSIVLERLCFAVNRFAEKQGLFPSQAADCFCHANYKDRGADMQFRFSEEILRAVEARLE